MGFNDSFKKIGQIGKLRIKPPAYEWQDLALQIIKELSVPEFKKSAVFKVCRDLPKSLVMQALIDTKELSKDGPAWKYFFKVISQK